jgi:hypothetical protein
MLMPKRVKYRKQHRGRRTGMASRGNEVNFGEFGLQALGRPGSTAARSKPPAAPSCATCAAAASCGSGCSLTIP